MSDHTEKEIDHALSMGGPLADVHPFRARLLQRFCAVHIGGSCEIGTRFTENAVDVTAQWLDELAVNLTHAQPTDVARFLHALAREIKRVPI